MSERDILNAIIREYGTRQDMRIWRNNSGGAVPWETVSRSVKLLEVGRVREAISVLRSRSVSFGVPGQADITGLIAGGRRLEIECKTDSGRQSEDQKNYETMIDKFGGLYVLARSVEDVRTALNSIG